jgi:hypothetical protein|nr:MAG TPA: hypothetical protein [Caudoviricetes sp.]
MKITKFEIILAKAVLEIADELELYERKCDSEISSLKAKLDSAAEKDARLSEYDRRVIERGRKEIAEESVYKFVKVSARENDGVESFDSFEEWLRKALHEVPEYFSKRDFIEYFYEELLEIYEERLYEAVSEHEVSEHEEGE